MSDPYLMPLFDRVILRETVIAGLNVEEGRWFEVVAAGPDAKHTKPEQVVLIPKYAGDEITIAGKAHMVIREADIMGVVGWTP